MKVRVAAINHETIDDNLMFLISYHQNQIIDYISLLFGDGHMVCSFLPDLHQSNSDYVTLSSYIKKKGGNGWAISLRDQSDLISSLRFSIYSARKTQ